jgi:ribosomal-protein-alanine N-acetyltransferase
MEGARGIEGERMNVVLETQRLRLVLPGPEAAPLLVRHFVENAAYRGPWDPPRPPTFLTLSYWRGRLAQARREYARRQSAKFVLMHEDAVAGTCNFTQVRGGACRVGYGLDRHFEGQGLMSEALGAAIPHVFEQFPVRKIVASYLEANARSARLLGRLGFEQDGRERKVQPRGIVEHLRVVLRASPPG